MILVDSTHWPLVVIGPVKAGCLPLPACGERVGVRGVHGHDEFARLASREPRAIALVIPGRGDEAVGALDALLAFLREFDGSVLAPATRLAWVAPDRTLRATLDAMLAEQGHCAFGRPSTTFAALLPALLWLFETVRPGRPRLSSSRHVLGHGR